MTLSLSLAEARRLALAAQGFGRTPRGAIAHKQLQAQIERLGVVQIDSELVSFSVTPAEGGASGFVIAVAVR